MFSMFAILYRGYKLPATVQVVTAGWQGSRGDTHLLARLGLSQAGLQDEKDALEKALAAKNRWRRKSSSKGRYCEPGASIVGSWPVWEHGDGVASAFSTICLHPQCCVSPCLTCFPRYSSQGQLTADQKQTRTGQQVGCAAVSTSGCCSARLIATSVQHVAHTPTWLLQKTWTACVNSMAAGPLPIMQSMGSCFMSPLKCDQAS